MAGSFSNHRDEAPRNRSRGASSDPHRLQLGTAGERTDLAEYLRLCGWDVELVGKRDLTAHHPQAADDGDDLVSLRFSTAVWRRMNGLARWISIDAPPAKP